MKQGIEGMKIDIETVGGNIGRKATEALRMVRDERFSPDAAKAMVMEDFEIALNRLRAEQD